MPWNRRNPLRPSLAIPLDTSNGCELACKHPIHLPHAIINESLHQKRLEEILSLIRIMYLPHLFKDFQYQLGSKPSHEFVEKHD
jgi:hypothetical protein